MSNKGKDFEDWGGVVTNADLANTPEGSLEELKNMRHLPGKLVKTYGAGLLQDQGANVCPITVASGYSVINIFTYINTNLDNGYKYVALIQNDTSFQVWIVMFDDTYNSASSEPSILLPFAEDSFWVKGDSQTFNDYGRVMLTNVVATDANALEYEFPATSTFHVPNVIVDTDTTALPGTIAYGGIQSELGISMYREDDVEVTNFNDTVAFDNEMIKEFLLISDELAIIRMQEASGKVFAITSSKGSATTPDKLWWYNSGWTQIASTDFGITMDTSDTLYLYHLAEMGGDLYMIFRHFDSSDAGSQYHYRMSRFVIGTTTWTNNIWEEDVDTADIYGSGLTTLPADDVTTAKYSTGGTDYLFISQNDSSTGTSIGGRLFKYSVAGGLAGLTKPASLTTKNRDSVGIAIADGELFMAVNNTSDSSLEIYQANTILTPGSWSALSLPTGAGAITGLSGAYTWRMTDFIISASTAQSGADLPDRLAIVAELDDGADRYFALLEYVAPAYAWEGDTTFYFDSSAHSIRSLYQSAHVGRTGFYYLSNVVESAVSSKVYISEGSTLVASVFYTATGATYYVPALLSYEVTLPSGVDASDHITSIHFLMGDLESSASTNPKIIRYVSFGANPDYSEYPANFVYEASFGACMGWIELFQALETDLEFDLYHKNDKNPIIMENGIVRFLAGAIGVDPLTSLIEAKGLWYGYIDRDYYDELYSPTAGFLAYDKTPLTPIEYPNSALTPQTSGVLVSGEKYLIVEMKGSDDFSNVGASGAVGYTGEVFEATGTTPTVWTDGSPLLLQQQALDLEMAGWGNEETRYVRYSYLYDGTQESLLSPAFYTKTLTAVDKAYFKLKLYDATLLNVRSSSRITGMNIYSMSGSQASAVATLIRSINFTLKAEDRPLYSTTGKTGLYVWVKSGGGTPILNKYIGNADQTAIYRQITALTVLDDGWLLETDAPTTLASASAFDAQYFLSPTGTTGSGGAGYDSGFYGGRSVLIDTSVDFRGLNPIGLAVASVKTDGEQVFSSEAGAVASDNTMNVLQVARYALEIDAEYVSAGDELVTFRYHLDTQPYVFYTLSGAYYLFGILDFINTQGDDYNLQNVKYIKVNPDFAKVMSGRLFTLSSILDPGGEGEERLDALGYSEVEQYDVIPVGNLKKFNDREGGGGTGLEELYGRPVVAFKQGISIMEVSDVSPANWTISESPHNIGNIAKRGMVSAIGTVYVCYYDGIYGLTANNLAETDKTPTDRLKITQDIEDKYQALTQTQKEAIVGAYDQAKNEILWTLGSEVWAYSTVFKVWREIDQTPDIDIITLDEDADIMFYDEADDSLRSFTNESAVASSMITKKYNIAIERDELLRYLWVFNPYLDAMTVTPYMDGVALTATTVNASTDWQKVVVKKRGKDFQFGVSWASSTNDNQLKRVGVEYDT